ncbi:hypothetical protein U1Q18_039260 [Sarracenia purpurea var. burkii]
MAHPGVVGTKFVSVNLDKSFSPAASQVRPGSHGSGVGGRGGAGGGGMVVLSRPRSSQKAGPKLSVPPPLNLPSLRREHERFDLSASGGGSPGGGGSGGGLRPTSSGWVKPGTVGDRRAVDNVERIGNAATNGNTPYMLPSARLGGVRFPVSVSAPSPDKTAVLKGEDFPSLQAAKPSSSHGPVQKQKDTYKKQKLELVGESPDDQMDSYTRIGGISSHHTFANSTNENNGESHGLGSSQMPKQAHKQEEELFPAPLPLIRLNPRSYWADDERGTGHCEFADRGRRDHGYSKSEVHYDRELDVPRNSVLLPLKTAHNLFERRDNRDDETRKVFSREIPKVDPCQKDVRIPTGKNNFWRVSALPKDGINAPGIVKDPILNFGRQKRAFSKNERPHLDESYVNTTSFDECTPFSGGLVSSIKRKKDVVKHADFHDPVRESFEAELERVQKMQEEERRRIIQEQERARREEEERRQLIQGEEDRQRRFEEEAREAAWRAEQEHLEAIRRAEVQKIAREEEKRRILMEEERRKQAAKQKLLELEARIAKRQAEAAKGDSCSAIADEKVSAMVMEEDVIKVVDLDHWEDSERTVERITTSKSSDSSGVDISFELGPGSQSSREGSSSGFLYRGKAANSWRSDGFENRNISSYLTRDENNGHHSPISAFSRKEFYGGSGYMWSRPYFRGGMQDPHMEEFTHLKGYKWNASDFEFDENISEKYSDVGWIRAYSHGNPHSSHPERLYFEEKCEASERVDIQLQSTMNQEQKLNKDTTQRCESQSSLSVSSPLNSPPHLYQDELDERGDSPVESVPTEGKEIPSSENEFVILNMNSGKDTVVKTASSSISADDNDGDWTLENNPEELQEQEEYDEDEDGYQEEDEALEGDVENIDLTREFEYLHLEDKGSSCLMDNLVLGFNEGVEVRIPGDEFDGNSTNEEDTFGIPEVSGSIMEEAEKEIQDSGTLRPFDPLDGENGSINSGEFAQHIDPSSDNMASHSSSGQTVLSSTVPMCSNLADSPVKLQFGLFSGPSLIPTPIPVIQIGSIQMPLHLHPSVGPSLAHIHPSQPPLFQFGHLRYSSPISQGILPMAPQSVSFVQPNVQAHYNLNQRSGGQDSSIHSLIKDDVQSVSVNRESKESNALIQKTQAGISRPGENKFMSDHGPDTGDKRHHGALVKNYRPPNGTKPEGKVESGLTPSQSVSREKDSGGSKAQVRHSSVRGKKFVYSASNYGLRSSFPASSHLDSSGFQRKHPRTIQRTEFRVQENVDGRQSSGFISSINSGRDEKSKFTGRKVGIFVKSGSKKGLLANKPLEQIVEPESLRSVPVTSKRADSENRFYKKIERGASMKAPSTISGEGSMKTVIFSEEDVNAPLPIGIVPVFKQPGIEAPSDEDDFIEVRSKRQMLNNRRERKEKEFKAKSHVTKVSAPRRPRSAAQSSMVSLGGEAPNNIHTDPISESTSFVNVEAPTGFSTVVSVTLAPIGTPSVNSDMQADKRRPHNIKSLQNGPASDVSNDGKNLGAGLITETNSKILDNVQTCMSSWGNAVINQQVNLIQTQLDEAMKPGRFEPHVPSTEDHTNSVTEPIMPSSSILTKDKSLSSSAIPINSLLAGEKIQFGAVISPTVFPNSRSVSNGSGVPGSCLSDIQITHNCSKDENECTFFFEKDKRCNESCIHSEDCEAEAAASAIAVAAISNDEIVGDGMGEGGGQQLTIQSKAEESLSVALPADLSIETPPISFWPPLPSPPNSSSQMFSHLHGSSPSHFPFYEMLGGPIFAFSPHNESAGTQLQSQKSAASGPPGSWQQCHSGVDSFYGPPAAFTGPFIGPSGGVQAPPHMVVYNHFPVGQFGQVGLSFMGGTYIPSGKHSDWKNNPSSSAMGIGEGDTSNINMVSVQKNPSNTAPPVHHLALGPQFLPMASHFAMFDMSPFQPGPELSVKGRWSQVPALPLHSIPLSMPLQQQEPGVAPSQFINHGHPIDQLLTVERFSDSQTATPSDSSWNFPVATGSTTTQFPNEFGLVNSLWSAGAVEKSSGAVENSPSEGTNAGVGKNIAQNDGSNPGQSTSSFKIESSNRGQSSSSSKTESSNRGQSTSSFKTESSNHGQSMSSFKTVASQQRNLSAQQWQNGHSTSYNYRRGRASQKNSSIGDWLHRKTVIHGRNQSLGTEKSCPPSKVKQIYVAKQAATVTSTVS